MGRQGGHLPWCRCGIGVPHLVPPHLLTPLGLRKLEAFFGLLIAIMALSFGYEVKGEAGDTPFPAGCWPHGVSPLGTGLQWGGVSSQ